MIIPEFEYFAPGDLREALDYLASHGEEAVVLAGGTDLLVRMKQRLVKPRFVVSLKNLEGLKGIREKDGVIVIGPMTPLVEVLENEKVEKYLPALRQAVGKIGAPSIQHFRGTIGGNLCLDTRCLFYNQSQFWRSGRTPCHKDNGQTCYAEENSDRCRSANQSDGACALMALGCEVILASSKGERVLPVEEFFTGKGEAPFAIEPDELVLEIRVPMPGEGAGSGFQKVSYRSAIDFALVSAAVSLRVVDRRIEAVRIAVGGAGAAPLLLKEAAATLVGMPIDDTKAIEATSDLAKKHASAFMVENLGSSLEYRQKMAHILVRRAIKEAIAVATG
ncbi:MAG: FAD binding domain-containing protein [Deltaproteobacteria bacterium]|nr:FAD binding domain-containing protein [Deltaproteobacteria bacterium]